MSHQEAKYSVATILYNLTIKFHYLFYCDNHVKHLCILYRINELSARTLEMFFHPSYFHCHFLVRNSLFWCIIAAILPWQLSARILIFSSFSCSNAFFLGVFFVWKLWCLLLPSMLSFRWVFTLLYSSWYLLLF